MPPLKPPQALLELPVCVGEGEGKVDHAVSLLQASELEAHVKGAVCDPIVGRVPHSLPTCLPLHLVENPIKRLVQRRHIIHHLENRGHALAEQLILFVEILQRELDNRTRRPPAHPKVEPGAIPILKLGALAIRPSPQAEPVVWWL